MNNTCNCSGMCKKPHVGMLFLRVVAGVVFIYSGWWKLQNSAVNVAGFAANHLPAWVAHGVTWLEIVGGVALILGLFTCFFASVFAIEMAVAFILTWKGAGFGMAQLPLIMTAAMVALKHGHHGMWSLGKRCGCLICRKKESSVQ